MTNEEKALQLANEYQDYIHKCKINLQLENQSKEETTKHCVKAAAIEMAEWKDMQYRAFLDNLADLGVDSELIGRMLKQYGINQ